MLDWLLNPRAARGSTGFVSGISAEAWDSLTTFEWALFFAIDDFELGRFDRAELLRRLEWARTMEEMERNLERSKVA